MTGYFVTGTDTGCGKTTVAAALLAALHRRGHRVAALKPIETGCADGPDGELIPADGLLLREACGDPPLPLDVVVPQRKRAPVAPAVAARSEPPAFSLARTRDALAHLTSLSPALLLVEGAGGLLVPYAEDLLAADVAAALELPLLLVARASLGTINHTLLTLSEARRRNLPVAGVILSHVAPYPTPDDASNASEIERLGQVRVLGTLPHVEPRTPAALATALESALDPTRLLD